MCVPVSSRSLSLYCYTEQDKQDSEAATLLAPFSDRYNSKTSPKETLIESLKLPETKQEDEQALNSWNCVVISCAEFTCNQSGLTKDNGSGKNDAEPWKQKKKLLLCL